MQDWDFYPCRVDDAPASIFLDLGFERNPRPAGADTLYWARIAMRDPDRHGMGSAAEAAALYPVEDEITARARAHGLVYVGRLRNDGSWQLTWYGPADRRAALAELVRGVGGLAGRGVETGSKPDVDWGYYRDFLLPDGERRQWMQDRRVVEQLRAGGDPLTLPRRVDHWITFPTASARDAFVAEVVRDGFAVEEANGAGACGARVSRVDHVELEAIHAVVVQLIEQAARRGGDYDGWETSVESGRD